MDLLIMGFFVAVNFLVIKIKIEKEKYGDAVLDFIILVIIGIFFSGSTDSLQIGTIASAFVSAYLYFYPPRLNDRQKETLSSEKIIKKFDNFKVKSSKIKIS